MIEIKMEGIKGLQDILSTLPAELQEKAMKVGVREGAAIIAQEARKMIPVGKRPFAKKRLVKKHLRDLVGYGIGRKHLFARSLGLLRYPGDTATYIVGLKKGGMHGVPVHFGHRIVSHRSKLQGPRGYWSNKGKLKRSGMVVGYIPPIPYVTDPMERNVKRITEIIKLRTMQAIESGVFNKGRVFRQK